MEGVEGGHALPATSLGRQWARVAGGQSVASEEGVAGAEVAEGGEAVAHPEVRTITKIQFHLVDS